MTAPSTSSRPMANSSPTCPNSTTSSSPFPTPTPPTSWTPSGSKPPSPQAPGPPCFKALLVVARRKRIGHASPAIPLTETREPGSMVLNRLRQGRRLHRAKACPSLRSREPRAELGATMSGGAEAGQSTRQRANLTQRTHTILDTDRKTSWRQLHSTHGLHFASRYCTNYRGPCVW